MPEEYNKTFKYNEGEKSIRLPFIITADLECLLEKMNTCHNNHLIIHCLHIAHLREQKISLIIVGVKIV